MTAVDTPPDTTARALTVDGIRTAIRPALDRIGATARAREDTRDYAYPDVYELAAHGVGLTGIARHEGGAGGTVRDVADLVITIARADSNVAQALRPTFLVAYQIAAREDVPLRAVNLERLRNRALFAGTGNERNGGASGSVSTTARRIEGGYLVNGRKYYSTGGLYASYFSTQAVTEDGTVLQFTVPVDRPGVDRLDDFDAIGQRLTQSGSTRLTDVHVAEDETVLAADAVPDNPWRGSFAQLYLAAVQAGIAARVLDDAVDYARQKGRPIKHSSATRSVDDPYIRETVGEIAARAQSARAAVLLAAEALQDQWGLRGEQAHRTGAETAVAVAQAGVVAIESALRAAELLFDVGGGSIT
ncbi:acyl-CoA dehydrogenase family protein, partial [Mycolicibacterium sp.]|uniref:acyl-CoA dehydrogenase family protein n=1 Tax=Mycolicibacterium sp. TaxID=2320850 RepID=UPI003D11B8E6